MSYTHILHLILQGTVKIVIIFQDGGQFYEVYILGISPKSCWYSEFGLDKKS